MWFYLKVWNVTMMTQCVAWSFVIASDVHFFAVMTSQSLDSMILFVFYKINNVGCWCCSLVALSSKSLHACAWFRKWMIMIMCYFHHFFIYITLYYFCISLTNCYHCHHHCHRMQHAMLSALMCDLHSRVASLLR